jgi:hypothetical protein
MSRSIATVLVAASLVARSVNTMRETELRSTLKRMSTWLVTVSAAVLVMGVVTPAALATSMTTPVTNCSGWKKVVQTNLHLAACVTRESPGPITYGQVVVKNFGSVPIHVVELRVRMENNDEIGAFVTCPINEAVDPGESRTCGSDPFSSVQAVHAHGQLDYSNDNSVPWFPVDSPPM